MGVPRGLVPTWSHLDPIPGFHHRCPRRTVVAALVYFQLGLVLLSVPGMV